MGIQNNKRRINMKVLEVVIAFLIIACAVTIYTGCTNEDDKSVASDAVETDTQEEPSDAEDAQEEELELDVQPVEGDGVDLEIQEEDISTTEYIVFEPMQFQVASTSIRRQKL